MARQHKYEYDTACENIRSLDSYLLFLFTQEKITAATLDLFNSLVLQISCTLDELYEAANTKHKRRNKR